MSDVRPGGGGSYQREVELVRITRKLPWDRPKEGGYAWQWAVRGRLGAISFTWVPDLPCWEGLNKLMHDKDLPGIDYPWGVDLSYHTDHPIREWHKAGVDIGKDDSEFVMHLQPCHLLPSGQCWTDGSSLRGEKVGQLMRREGEDAVWACLADEYHLTFYDHTPAVGILLGDD